MKNLLVGFVAFTGRHWLRIGIVVAAFIIVNRKQIDFSIRLGAPQVAAAAAEEPRVAENGLLSGFSFFGSEKRAAAPEPVTQPTLLQAIDEERALAFIDRFAHVARSEQEKYGIPASIILANGLLGTAAGTTDSARDFNNYFNLPCGVGWSGASTRIDGICRRQYETAWLSFRDHSQYLTSGRFRGLRDLPATDHRRWAAGLERLTFNEIPNLSAQLLETIARYKLDRFDHHY